MLAPFAKDPARPIKTLKAVCAFGEQAASPENCAARATSCFTQVLTEVNYRVKLPAKPNPDATLLETYES